MTSSTPPVVLVDGGAVLLTGRALIDVAALVSAGIRAAYRQDGIAASRRLQHLSDLLNAAAAAQSVTGHENVRAPANMSPSTVERIDTRETARMLGVTERQVRRLAGDLHGRRSGNALTFDPAVIAAHLTERNPR